MVFYRGFVVSSRINDKQKLTTRSHGHRIEEDTQADQIEMGREIWLGMTAPNLTLDLTTLL
jgi:hypothetical protein